MSSGCARYDYAGSRVWRGVCRGWVWHEREKCGIVDKTFGFDRFNVWLCFPFASAGNLTSIRDFRVSSAMRLSKAFAQICFVSRLTLRTYSPGNISECKG